MSAPEHSAAAPGALGDRINDLEMRTFVLAVDLRAIERREAQLVSVLDELAGSIGLAWDAHAGKWGPAKEGGTYA